MSRPLRVGIAGLGVVGSGLADLILNAADRFAARGAQLTLAAVSARTRNRDRGVDLSAAKWFDDPIELARSDDIDVFVELIGGSDGPARASVEAALRAGKPVATANKALIAEHGMALAAASEEAGAPLEFEAAVAGGVPAIRVARDALAPNAIRSVSGILNGTCNYILTEMDASGAAYGDVLAEAQRLGYAEADPSFDVGGVDAAHKLAILASICFGVRLNFAGVSIEGIEKISALDVRFARELGYRLKLIAAAEMDPAGALSQSMRPSFIPLGHPLAEVDGVENAIAFEADPVGRIFLSGPGAGRGPTAAAVAADLCDIAAGDFRPPLGRPASQLADAPTQDPARRRTTYYLRVSVSDSAGVIAAITDVLARRDISIDGILQHPSHAPDKAPGSVPVAITTHACEERGLRLAIADIVGQGVALEDPVLIPIETG